MTVYPDATTGRMEGCHHTLGGPNFRLCWMKFKTTPCVREVYERAIPRQRTNVLS